jgi:hypothetical protein
LAHNCKCSPKKTQPENPPCAAQVILGAVPRKSKTQPSTEPRKTKIPTPPPLLPQPFKRKELARKNPFRPFETKHLPQARCCEEPAQKQSASDSLRDCAANLGRCG